MSPLISADELVQLEQLGLSAPTLVILDVRWALGRSDGREKYLNEHIPGAVYVDLERDLTGAVGTHTGRHPLPDPADFERAARSWGIEQDSQVVVYDDAGALAAARAWWLFKHAGFDSVRVLDGGLDAWKQSARLAGHEPADGDEVNPAGAIALSWGAMPVLEYPDLADYSGVLIDSRATVRYLGIEEPIDPVAGHIPGARNRPTADNLDAQALFRSPEALAEEFDRLLGTETQAAAYCGSGITAAHQVLAAAYAGRSLGLYPGSWSQYVSYPQSPVVTSDEQHRS